MNSKSCSQILIFRSIPCSGGFEKDEGFAVPKQKKEVKGISPAVVLVLKLVLRRASTAEGSAWSRLPKHSN